MKWILALLVFILSFVVTLGAISTRDVYINSLKNNLNSTSTTKINYDTTQTSEVLAVNTSTNSFYLTPEAQNLNVGQTFDVEVRLNAVTNVNGVEVNLSYPANLLKVNSITDGSFGITASKTFSNGSISLAYGNVSPLTGDILVATIRFQSLSSGTASVTFSNSRAVSSSTNQNVLNSVNNATYIIGATPTVNSTNTTLYFSPSTANINTGSEFDVQVRLNADVSVNALETDISFPSSLLDVVSINNQGGALEIEASKTVSNGNIYLAYGSSVPKTGNNLLITTIKFKSKAAGSAVVKHNNANVLSSINNQNVLNSTTQATYNIISIPTPTQIPTSNPVSKDDIFPWIATDIGNPLQGGQVKVSEGNYDIIGSGADIWGTSDQFRYAYQAKSGDFTLTTQVINITNTDPWAKSGIMIRESTASNSRYAYVFATPGSNGANFEYRSSTGGFSAKSGSNSGTDSLPVWLRITKSGTQYTAFYSANGSSWTQLGNSVNLNMATTLAGMAVTSHNNTVFSSGEFRDLAFSAVATPTLPPTATPTNTPTLIPTVGPLTPTNPPQSIPTSTVIPNSPTPGLTCDPNSDGIINILDFQWWKDEYFGVRSSKDTDCFNQDGKVDLLDFQVWKDISITKVKQPF